MYYKYKFFQSKFLYFSLYNKMENINVKNLYTIFFGRELVKLSQHQPKTPTKAKPEPDILSPMAKTIYQATSPRSRSRILKEMQANVKAIERQEKKGELIDPDFQEKMENNGLGFFMENFLSVYGMCPVCGENTLRKYLHSNVPVVDLVCVNKDYHLKNNKCFLFQVKISLTDEYFSLTNHKITVGSKTYGAPAHLHKGTDSMLDKLVIPGYICLKLNEKKGDVQTYNIDHRNSFVLIPNYQNLTEDYYYEYLDEPHKFNKNVIRWNPNMVDTFSVDKVTKANIVHYEIFSEEPLTNPYQFLIK